MSRMKFPEGFIWGAATSSQQIEGATGEGGRGESIWDRFSAVSGKIEDGSNSDIACDHFHRWRDDIELMKWLGLGAYRFSIAWPRIIPTGTGLVNAAGLDFYDSLVDGLLEAGIEPFPTLYHWDLPQVLQDKGGWAARDTAEAFVEYSAAVARRLGDRVKRWVTHNEPWCIATLGHEEGHHAPGHLDPPEALRVAHHLLLSHGWATEAIRREVANAEVGIVHNYCPAYSATDSEGDRDAARWFDGFFNRWYLDPVFKGAYPADAVADRVAAAHGPNVAQYAVPFAYRVRYYIHMNAREAFHFLELRSQASGHPGYRRVAQEMHRLIRDEAGHQVIADAMQYVDHNDYDLARLEEERRNEARRAARADGP